jgi:DNA-binding MarR family transcriptional regulator
MLLGNLAQRYDSDQGGLTYSQMRLLGTLEEIQPATQHRLAQALGISDPAVSRALQSLDADGLVRIVPDPAHRKRRLVHLTETGQEAFHDQGKPLYEQLRSALIAAGFPYERYLSDTVRLTEILESA